MCETDPSDIKSVATTRQWPIRKLASTLVGLVGLGEPEALAFHLGEALRSAELCGSDPLCAEHEPTEDGMALHAAACHSCLYVPETSCERGNRYLDRSVLMRTLEHTGNAFFPE